MSTRSPEANLTTQDGVWPWLQTTGAPRRNCEEILAHELGHALGLDHPCGTFGQCDRWSWDALMRGWVHEDGRGAALSVDDREAARALYPGGAPGPDGSSASCVADDSSLCLLDGCWPTNWATLWASTTPAAASSTAIG